MNYAVLVEHYNKHHKQKLRSYLDWFRSLDPLTAVRNAALALRRDGRKHKHQGRVSDDVLEQVADNLAQQIDAIKACCPSFHKLYRLVKGQKVTGFGRLGIYDTALRIGANLEIYPARVYPQRGTRKGCKALGLKEWQADTLPVSVFPEAIQALQPYEIENFLCIYKDRLGDAGEPLTASCLDDSSGVDACL